MASRRTIRVKHPGRQYLCPLNCRGGRGTGLVRESSSVDVFSTRNDVTVEKSWVREKVLSRAFLGLVREAVEGTLGMKGYQTGDF